MPQRSHSPRPKVMTWGRAAPTIAIAGVFDLLRLMFEWFVVFGPALFGVAAGVAASSYVGTTIGSGVGVVAAGLAGFFGGGAFEVFGIVMAMAIGLLGWMTILLLFTMTDFRIFKENTGNIIWLMFGLIFAEIPFVGSLPSLTGMTVMMYRTQIRKEKAALKRWEEEETQIAAGERASQMAMAAQIQAARAAQEDAQREEEIPEETKEAA